MRKIEIYEVGPRDGFQNIPEYIALETKKKIIEGLLASGVAHMQITSFVSPKAIPQMKDATELTGYLVDKYPDADLMALVPNLRGAQGAWDAGLKTVSYVVSLGESHNKANIRRTHEESLSELLKIREALPDLDICLDLATTFGCPFEGKKYASDAVPFLKPYVEAGVSVINLCDTIGVANPAQVRETIDAVKAEYPDMELEVHIHDTRNMGMVNTLAAIERGVNKVQSTLGGLGGCPFAPGASGNLATEDLAFMLTEMGYDTGINIEKMVELAKYQLGEIPSGKFSGHLLRIQNKNTEE
ncbi:MAG: hydroxymethylglutaryl-CoA lyase [Spirochaetales bacterium]|uniref:Hydroxymethylglutaryl-CoA lyase n=1 Tax=Candidatus Thalassospirochaeta sargassi TaxID=3119039 RepID=A0AAJ1IHU5_9SPIO|nr:hydroxymethylglutaryl-CoA lyase [Spirochaetales bacterium]